MIRKNNDAKHEGGIASAVDRAIGSIPDDFVIKPFLVEHRAEVKGMLLTEYNEAEAMELFKEDGRRVGRAEGRAEGRGEDIRSLMETLGLTVDQAMDALRIPVAERNQYLPII